MVEAWTIHGLYMNIRIGLFIVSMDYKNFI